MEKIVIFESYIINIKNKQVNEIDHNNVINLLKELSELDPKCKYHKYLIYYIQ